MKRHLLFLFGIILSLQIFGQYNSDKAKKDYLFSLCRKYAPEVMPILECERNVGDVKSYVEGSTPLAMIKDLGTLVHEGLHSYENDICGETRSCNGYFLGEGIEIQVVMGKVFKTPEMDRMIPDALKDEDFNSRYDPYVVGDMTISSHTQGMYGLMEEMNAYWVDGYIYARIWPFLIKENGGNPKSEFMLQGVFGMGSSMIARHQFRYFLAWYLEYAQKKYPEVFDDLMANQRLRLVYTLLEIQYAELEVSMENAIQDYIQMAQEAGYESYVEDGFLYLKKNGSSSGRGIFTEERDALKSHFLPKWQQYLDDFKLPNATLQNWKEFL